MDEQPPSNQWGIDEAFKTLESLTEGSSAAKGAMRFLRSQIERQSASEPPVDTCREPVPCAAQLVLDRVEQAFREAGYVGDDLVEGVANLRALFDAARATQPPGADLMRPTMFGGAPAAVVEAVAEALVRQTDADIIGSLKPTGSGER